MIRVSTTHYSFFRILTLTSFLLITFSVCGKTSTKVSSGFVNGIWVKNGSPYYLSGNVVIRSGEQLAIESAVQVIGHPGSALTVYGIIKALGTPAEKIIFTASDTVKGWHGIHYINADKGNHLLHCSIMYGRTDGVENNETPHPKQDVPSVFRTNGGGIFCLNSSPLVEHCIITNNLSAGNGGGIFIDVGTGPRIIKSVIAFNRSMQWGGGGIYSSNASTVIEDCHIESNVAMKWTGGGIYIIGSKVLLKNNIIKNNSSYGGGGIFLQGDSSLIQGCAVNGNNAKYGGGIECNEKCYTKIVGNNISDNTADFGGGLALVEQTFVSVEDCKITGNLAHKTGGGIFTAEVGRPLVLRSIINGNISEGNGGGISCLDVEPFLEDVLITNNQATGNGGGLYLEFANPILRSVSVVKNASYRGGGMYFKNCPSIEFSKSRLCNIHQNIAREFGSDLFVLGGPVTHVPLDTFSVAIESDIHVYPMQKLKIKHRHTALSQEETDLYVSPDGDDNGSGISSSPPLKTIRMAFMKILADSLHPRTIQLDDGEYDGAILSSPFAANYLKYVSISGGLFADVRFSADKIIVLTPWWKSPWAFILYLLLIGVIIYIAYQARFRNFHLKQQVEMEHFQTERLAEVDKLKSRFFSNISHEFRTPLTLIIGPADQALDANDMKTVRQKLSLIKDNAKKLFGLVNQLLDFSRLESGVMKLQVSNGDVMRFLRRVVMSFESWAERKKISLEFTSDVELQEGFFDADKLEKIVNNLMSNALKFTPEGGSVEVVADFMSAGLAHNAPMKGAASSITVRDTGPGISPEHLPHIFDRFYRVDETHTTEGTGIGLALTKELVDVHHGTITAESTIGKGSVFTVILPIDKSSYTSNEIVETQPLREEQKQYDAAEPSDQKKREPVQTTAENGKPIILIVEDNTDLRSYISEYMNSEYSIREAANGKIGYDIATEIVPDLVISDVMMPEMDGIELCKALKQDVRTSHIPVILLTARASTDSKIEGLEIGADDYVTKPFDSKELLARVKNLIEQRRQLRKKFSAGVVLKPGEVAVTSLDDSLLKKVMSAVEKNIADEDFGVEKLSQEACLSRAQLNRKLHALTNLSPAEFIRYVRLQRARELLEKNVGTVADVAHQVGFSSPAYFSSCFHERFGYPPSEASNRAASH